MTSLNEQIALLKAESEGREIEVLGNDGKWYLKPKGNWKFYELRNRIKPRMKRMEQIEHLRFTAACHAMQGMLTNNEMEFSFLWEHESGEKRLLGYGSNPAGGGWTMTRTPLQGLTQSCVNHANALLKELGYE